MRSGACCATPPLLLRMKEGLMISNSLRILLMAGVLTVGTCMTDAPDPPGPDPMCFDQNAANWVQAWVGHKPPPANAVGLMYMLEGGTDASNTDPYAKQPTADNDWVKTGPHIMVVGSKDILAGHPAGAKPDTAAPYVMWAGTPYAHLM